MRCWLSARRDSVFMGMFQLSGDAHTSDLMVNLYALAFMICGIALPLEQASEYLIMPDYVVYVRQHRGFAHFARYFAMITVYCLVFTGMQSLFALAVVPEVKVGSMLSTSACAGWTLLCLLLLVNLGYLLTNRAMGYVAAMASYALLLSIGPVARWFALGHVGMLPAWAPALLVSLLLITALNAMAFDRIQIL